MSTEVFREIQDVINVLKAYKVRAKELEKDLEIAEDLKDFRSDLIGSFKRLEHEIMFLCIDMVGLYKAIRKKKSLYSKVIAQNGATLSKVNRSKISEDHFIFIDGNDAEAFLDEDIEDDGCQLINWTQEDKQESIQKFEEEVYSHRKQIRDKFGLTSSNQSNIEQWMDEITDKKTLARIEDYRNNYAHRLDDLSKLKSEFEHLISIEGMRRILNDISMVLLDYEERFQKILLYTCSDQFLGIDGFEYRSFSEIEAVRKSSHFSTSELESEN
ncbi:MAG: hypothetical protein ACPGVO_01145 [Spirulinaceae cyanobacterium]